MINLPDLGENRIIVIEGIAGAGKDTIQSYLAEEYTKKGYLVYSFSEDELLFSWKHAWMKGIEEMRLDFMNYILDYCEKTLKENQKVVFILNRFHVSFSILAKFMDENISRRYNQLIERIKSMPVYVCVPTLEKHQIEARSSHKERKEKAWTAHQQKRLETRGFNNLTEMYVWEQNQVLKLLKEQGIPYSLLKI